jgi:hypothetical protein
MINRSSAGSSALYAAPGEILTVFTRCRKSLLERAIVCIRVAIEISRGLHRRRMPSTLKKKLDSTIWTPKVSDTNPGTTTRRVLSGSSGPNA